MPSCTLRQASGWTSRRRQNASGEWVITVTDEGSGVPPSELEAIFEPFFRGRTEGGYSGYGLGLAITQRVVQAHGGTVKAANREEGGLAVTITLQASRPVAWRVHGGQDVITDE